LYSRLPDCAELERNLAWRTALACALMGASAAAGVTWGRVSRLLVARPPRLRPRGPCASSTKEAPRRGQSEALDGGESTEVGGESRASARRSQFSSVSRGKAGLSPVRRPVCQERLRGVDSLNWPCGQNPGRKPEGRQRDSTREAMSLGKQRSTCRASTLCVRAERPRTLPATGPFVRYAYSARRIALYTASQCEEICSMARAVVKAAASRSLMILSTSARRVSKAWIFCPRLSSS
jgi:hypothetical protein